MASRVAALSAALLLFAWLLVSPAPVAARPDPAPEPAADSVAAASEFEVEGDQAGGAPVTEGGGSPFCHRDGLDAESEANCKRSHSIARSHPLSSYGLDKHVELGVKNLPDLLPWGIQWMLVIVWQALLAALNGILMLLDWAFSLDLVGRALGSIRTELANLNDNILGDAWLLAAISIAGLWGIWNGLVRLRTLETLGGLGMTVLLMCAALLIVHQPGATVGRVSELANETSVDALGLASSGTIDNPTTGYAEATRKLFDTIALEPWCALEFGDVAYCGSRLKQICMKDQDGRIRDGKVRCRSFDGTVADAWLSYPAGSEQRLKLYLYLKEKDPSKVRLQDVGGTTSRSGLLALVVAGDLGALALLGYFGLRLILAAVFVLGLLLAAPVMLAAPALGETGRQWFLTWLKRLGGAAVAKLVYAFALAIVILIAATIARLDGIGWYGKWIILAAFWWGVFFKREDLVGFVLPASPRGGSKLTSLYYGYRMSGDAARAITSLPRRTARLGTVGVRRVGRGISLRRRSRDAALRRDAEHQLRRRGENEVRQAKEMEAAPVVGRESSGDRRRLDRLDAAVRSVDGELSNTRRRRDALRAHLGAMRSSTPPTGEPGPEQRRAEEQLSAADREVAQLETQHRELARRRNQAERERLEPGPARSGPGGQTQVSESEINDWIARRDRELAGTTGGDAEDERDRQLLGRVDGNGMIWRERRRAKREVKADPERKRAVRDWKRREGRSERREMRWQRRRAGMGRR